MTSKEFSEISYNINTKVRVHLENKYGKDTWSMQGKCIEATDILVAEYNKHPGIKAKAKRVWVLYERFESCSDYCYEEHWLCELLLNSKTKVFVDVTMDQFQWAFSRELPRIYVNSKLPNFYLTRKPGKTIFDRCGWTDWYNYGQYENNFDYYE